MKQGGHAGLYLTRGRRTAVLLACVGILLLGGGWRMPLAEESPTPAAAPATAPAEQPPAQTTAAAVPEPAQGVDAVLVIDSSGSMKETDPRRLRVPAAKMFVSLLDAQDRVGLISFSDDAYPVTPLTSAEKGNQAKLFAGIDKVSAKGAYTNLHAALAKGMDMLEREGDKQRRRMLVLMSDGKMDTGDFDKDKALIEKIRGETLEALAKDGIEVYTIAFTEASDMPLLREIAGRTAALSRLASNDRELHEVFSQIFESAKQPDMLPMEGGAFMVDAAVEEVTVVASKAAPDVEIKLEMPDGRAIVAANAGKAVRWFKSEQFDMITVEKPPAGQWHLRSSDNRGDKAYVVTHLGMDARIGEAPIYAKAEQSGEAWLHDKGEIITKPEILDQTQFHLEIVPPEGAQQDIALADAGQNGDRTAGDGAFANVLSFAQPGQYQVRAIAKNANFQREKSLIVDVVEPNMAAAAPTQEPAAEAPAAEPAPVQPAEAKPEVTPEQPAAPQEGKEDEKEGLNIGLIVSLFVLVNLLIGAGVGGFLFWRRRRAAKAAPAADAEDEDGNENEK